MQKIQVQGVHHITLTGADRQTSIDFWEGVLGMPFIFEQPNLDDANQNHIYFDPGDGRLITIFTNETWAKDPSPVPDRVGALHHLAFNVSRSVFNDIAERLEERGIPHSGIKDRGFMDSYYFRDPIGLRIELATYKFEPPLGVTYAQVLREAHDVRVKRQDPAITEGAVREAIENLVKRELSSLSDDTSPKNPYA